jgi:hypothetical protein
MACRAEDGDHRCTPRPLAAPARHDVAAIIVKQLQPEADFNVTAA